MKKSTQIIIVGMVLTVLSGVLRGKLDNRWGTEELNAAAEAVNALPTSIGSWTTDEVERLSEEASTMLRCAGNSVGAYSNRSGDAVNMVLLVGPAGPLAVHTPEVCYGSNNFTIHESTQATKITDSTGKEHDFSVVTFRENKAGNRLLRVYYAWNRDQTWVAPSSPRSAFAGIPMLYKVQVATHDVQKDRDNLDAGERFLGEALPLLGKITQ